MKNTLIIIYEDDNILAVDKPSGMVMHPFDFSNEETLLDVVGRHSPKVLSIQNLKKLQDKRTINLGGLVHKLDRETSGIVVFAKNTRTFDELSAQFKNHEVIKEYCAKVSGAFTEKIFTINAPLAREKKSYKQSVNPTSFRGNLQEAITRVKVLCELDNETIVNLSPKTGRTHQLRAHMAHIGHPIMGDKVYGGKEAERLMLHARRIDVTINGERKILETEIPESLRCPQ